MVLGDHCERVVQLPKGLHATHGLRTNALDSRHLDGKALRLPERSTRYLKEGLKEGCHCCLADLCPLLSDILYT